MEPLVKPAPPALDPQPEYLPEALFRLPHAVLTAAIRRELPLREMNVSHLFAEGVAVRMLRLPAASIATARRHLRTHLCFFLQGSMTVWQDGEEPRVIDAPAVFVAQEGDQFCGYAHTESLWATVFPNPTNETDEDVLLDANEAAPPEPTGAVPLLREIFPYATRR